MCRGPLLEYFVKLSLPTVVPSCIQITHSRDCERKRLRFESYIKPKCSTACIIQKTRRTSNENPPTPLNLVLIPIRINILRQKSLPITGLVPDLIIPVSKTSDWHNFGVRANISCLSSNISEAESGAKPLRSRLIKPNRPF